MPGSAAIRLSAVEQLLADSAAFRAKVGAQTPDAAKAFIYFDEQALGADAAAGVTLSGKRPCAILSLSEHGYHLIGQGSQHCLGGSGAVFVLLADNPEQPENHKASQLAFVDWTSQVIDDVAAIAGRNTDWPVHSIQMQFDPFRPNIADRQSDDFWLVGYAFSDSVDR